MKTLFIDTHYMDIIIALLDNETIISKKEVINKKNNSEFIFPTIIDVIKDEKIDSIVVVNGPGSFTGVRLGVTIAKTMAYTMNLELKVIDSLKVTAISSGILNIALSDGNGYYIGKFDNNYNALEDYYYINEKDSTDLSSFKTDYEIDIEKVVSYLKNEDSINPHLAKPVYVKKIGVEIDKSS